MLEVCFFEMKDAPKALIVIPARLASTRLPGKPLVDLEGKPMILHVLTRAMQANIAPVVVACADQEIAKAVQEAGGQAVWIEHPVPTGSDIVYEAVQRLDPQGHIPYILNVQGDLPVFDPSLLVALLDPFDQDPSVDVVTPVVRQQHQGEVMSPHVVKVQFQSSPEARSGCVWEKAIGFSRKPYTSLLDLWYQHVGVYAYRRDALKRFVHAPQSVSEQQEKLEQLRALDLGMHIAGVVVDVDIPLSVDTPQDLEKVRQYLVHASGLRVA